MDKEFLINNQELKQQITRICVDYPDVMDSVVFRTKHDYSLSYSSYASPYVHGAVYTKRICFLRAGSEM